MGKAARPGSNAICAIGARVWRDGYGILVNWLENLGRSSGLAGVSA